MRKLAEFLMQLGVVKGITFRLTHEDGVGLIVEPNPMPNRMQPRGVPDLTLQGTGRRFHAFTFTGNREARRKASGSWTAKPLHVVW